MYYVCVTLTVYIAEMYIVYFYSKSIYDYKKDNRFAWAISLIAYGLAFIGFLTLDNPGLNVLLITIANFSIFKIAFKSTIRSSLFNSVLITAFMALTEFIVLFITSNLLHLNFDHYDQNALAYTIDAIISKVMLFVICRVIAEVAMKEKNKKQIGRSWYLMIVPLTTLAILFALRIAADAFESNHTLKFLCTISALLLITLNIVVYAIYESVQKNNKKILELEIEKKKTELDETYVSIIEKQNTDLQIIIHDIKNHLIAINSLDEINEIHDYVNSIYTDFEKYKPTGKTGNKILDVIINKYKTMANNININFKFSAFDANLGFMNDEDISVFINNLLDNAFESAEQTNDKNVEITLSKNSDRFYIVDVINSCENEPKTIKDKLVSSKANKFNHGFGTISINKISVKYQAISKWQYDNDNNVFTYSFAFPINDN